MVSRSPSGGEYFVGVVPSYSFEENVKQFPKDIAAGEEMFINYTAAFAKVEWYDTAMKEKNLTPLSWLGAEIDAFVRAQKK